MPIMRCKKEGTLGWKFGSGGKCYTGAGAKAKAKQQGRAIQASGFVDNAKRSSNTNLLRADPTRSAGLRRRARSKIKKAMADLEFSNLLGHSSVYLLNDPITKAYTKGVTRSFDQVRLFQSIHHEIEREEFMRFVPYNSAIQRLHARVSNELRGIFQSLQHIQVRTEIEAEEKDQSESKQRAILRRRIRKLQTRAMTVVDTEIVRAFVRGQLDGFVPLQVQKVRIRPEQGCRECAKASKSVFTLKQAQDVLPLHPLCRCIFTPHD